MTDGPTGDAPLTDEERAREMIDQLRRLRVEDLAYDMAVSLVQVGYQKMGLTDETRELRSLEDARLAIDLLRAVLPVLHTASSRLPLADLEGTLAQMQLNYVRAAQMPDAVPRDQRPADGGREADEAGDGGAEAPGGAPRERAAETPEPSEEPRPAEEPPAKAAPKKPAAKRPAAKKPAAKKPAAGKPAGDKPAAKKPAAGKGATGKSARKVAGKDQGKSEGDAGSA